MDLSLSLIIPVAVIIAVAIIGFLFFRAAVRSWYKVPAVDQALIIVGKSQKSTSGAQSNISVKTGTGAFVNPLTQTSSFVPLRSRQVTMTPSSQSSNGIPVRAKAVANIKIDSDPDKVRRAAERFAPKFDTIEAYVTEQLEGELRGVMSQVTFDELVKDRNKVSADIAENVVAKLAAQGLVLDSFSIQSIDDLGSGYQENMAAREIAERAREADIARIESERETRRAQVTADEQTLIEQTQLQRNQADAKQAIGIANAKAEQAESLARSQAYQEVLKQDALNKQAQLDAEVNRVADAKLYESQRTADAEAYQVTARAKAQAETARAEAEATTVRADAEANSISAIGRAKAEAIRAEAEALAEHGQALLASQVVEHLPQLAAALGESMSRVGSVTLIGGEQTASGHAANEATAGIAGTFATVKAATGVDIPAMLNATAAGRGFATGTAAEQTEASSLS